MDLKKAVWKKLVVKEKNVGTRQLSDFIGCVNVGTRQVSVFIGCVNVGTRNLSDFIGCVSF